MALSNDLISQFVKATKDNEPTKKESTAYGKIVKQGDVEYVQLDGSDLLTPISSTTVVNDGDRVMVTIKNHTAIVTGDLTHPSASNKDVIEIGNTISEFEIVIADKVSTKQLEAEIAKIDKVIADDINAVNAKFETIDAKVAEIDEIKADMIEVDGKLTAHEGEFTTIRADIADFKDLTAEEIEAIDGKFTNLESDYATFKETTTNKITANTGNITELQTKKLDAETATITYANIDFSNIKEAAIEKLFTESGIIKDLIMSDGKVTGELVGVTIKGDLIEGNTVKADKLVILGEDGLYYKLNVDSLGETTASSDEKYQNGLDGSVIIAKSITADRVAVTDLVAFGATIGGYHITDHALYSGTKNSATNTTRGVFLGDDGQLAVGDANNYLKFFIDENNQYKLEIRASAIKMGATGTTVEDALKDVSNKAIVSSVEQFYLSTSPTELKDGSWSESQPAWTEGKYIWRRTYVTKGDGTTSYQPNQNGVCITGNTGTPGTNGTDGKDGKDGADGNDGKGIKSITKYYLATDKGVASGYDWISWDGDITDLEAIENLFGEPGLNAYKRLNDVMPAQEFAILGVEITYSEGGTDMLEIDELQPLTDDGKVYAAGAGMLPVVVVITESTSDFPQSPGIYFLNWTNMMYTSQIVMPARSVTTETEGWTTTIQTTDTTNKYLWSYEVITYTDNSTYTSTPIIIGTHGETGADGKDGKDGNDGANGSDGKGIKSITKYYLASNIESAGNGAYAEWDGDIAGREAVEDVNGESHMDFYKVSNDVYSKEDVADKQITVGIVGMDMAEVMPFDMVMDMTSDGNVFMAIAAYGAVLVIKTPTVEYPQSAGTYFSRFLNEDNIVYTSKLLSEGISTETEGWTTTIQTTDTTNKYLWSYEVITYTDNSTYTSDPVIIGTHGETGADGKDGNDGANGSDGKGIKSITKYYLASPISSGSEITWDGNTSGLTNIQMYYKMSDRTLTSDMLIGETVQYMDNGTTKEVVITEDMINKGGETVYVVMTSETFPLVYMMLENMGTYSKGLYFTKSDSRYTTKLTVPEITPETEGWTISTQMTDDVNKYLWSYETVEYTDGSLHTVKPIIIGVYGETEGLVVGGRNYIQKSNYFENGGTTSTGITGSVDENGVWKIVTTSGNDNAHSWTKNNNIEANLQNGDEFTFSIEIKCDEGSTGKPKIYFKDGMGYYPMEGEVSTEYSTLYYSGTWSDANDIQFKFGWSETVGTFYIRSMKFEKGNKPTDWTPAPEDIDSSISNVEDTFETRLEEVNTAIQTAEATIETLSNMISHLVTDGNGGSLMTQTPDGWTFNMSSIDGNLNAIKEAMQTMNDKQGNTSDALQKLTDLVDSVAQKTAYITLSTVDEHHAITWDGNKANLDKFQDDMLDKDGNVTGTQLLYKVSDEVPDNETLVGGTISIYTSGSVATQTIKESDIVDIDRFGEGNVTTIWWNELVFIVRKQTVINGYDCPPGVYFWLSSTTNYVSELTYAVPVPCIELGKTDSLFKVRITNTAIDFLEGSTRIAYANNNTFYSEKIITNELQIGEGPGFVWRTRENGNLGLVYISK